MGRINKMGCPNCQINYELKGDKLVCPQCGLIAPYQPAASYQELLTEIEKLKAEVARLKAIKDLFSKLD